MSQKNILNLVYNPSSLNLMATNHDDLPSQQIATTTMDAQESLQVISEIVHEKKNPKSVVRSLKKLKHLIQNEIPLSFRPELFKEMNHVVKVLQKQYPDSRDVFSAAFHTLTSLKQQIDKTPQSANSLAELEWVELEKAVYLLCNWEDEIDAVRT